MGSRSAGFAFMTASRKASMPACSKATWLESTSWYEPNTSWTRMLMTG